MYLFGWEFYTEGNKQSNLYLLTYWLSGCNVLCTFKALLRHERGLRNVYNIEYSEKLMKPNNSLFSGKSDTRRIRWSKTSHVWRLRSHVHYGCLQLRSLPFSLRHFHLLHILCLPTYFHSALFMPSGVIHPVPHSKFTLWSLFDLEQSQIHSFHLINVPFHQD